MPHKLFTLKNNVCFRYKVYVVCFIVTYVHELIEVIIVGFENNYMYLDNFRPPTYTDRFFSKTKLKSADKCLD